LIYRPSNQPSEPVALEARLSVKFSKAVFLMKSFLDHRKIEYSMDDLEMTPYGWAYRLKNDDGSPVNCKLKLEEQ
jgi:hypothetical protein